MNLILQKQTMKNIKIKRIYDNYSSEDGSRILVDRLWPRGIKKENAKIDEWIKDIAPSDSLRKWFNHDPEKWEEFKKKYFDELNNKKDSLRNLVQKGKATITLIYSAKDKEYNNAVALKEYLEGVFER
jgi:uncharacterized protein YeaO (DUF488 family)